MKYLFTFLLIIQGSILLLSQPQFRAWNNPVDDINQTLHTHDPTDDFMPARISEDFGPRQLNDDQYQWHGGIDYNSGVGEADLGDLILAMEGGTRYHYGLDMLCQSRITHKKKNII